LTFKSFTSKSLTFESLTIALLTFAFARLFYHLTLESCTFRSQAFPIRAEDGGKRPLTSSQEAQVVVRVQRNDRAPTFVNEPYEYTIRRTAEPGSPITRVTANDEDDVVRRGWGSTVVILCLYYVIVLKYYYIIVQGDRQCC
jgi:hypothetical protein